MPLLGSRFACRVSGRGATLYVTTPAMRCYSARPIIPTTAIGWLDLATLGLPPSDLTVEHDRAACLARGLFESLRDEVATAGTIASSPRWPRICTSRCSA
jgi:hypothetical protein